MKHLILVIVLTVMGLYQTTATALANSSVNQAALTDSPTTLLTMESISQNLDLTVSLKVLQVKSDFDDEWGGSDYPLTMYGPMFLLSYNDKLYANLSYFRGSSDEGLYGELKESDFDLRAGYLFHPRAAFYVGYKTINFDFDGGLDFAFKGYAIGIDGNYPLFDTGLMLFCNLEYSFLGFDVNSDNSSYTFNTEDTEGYLVEAGIAYSFQSLPQMSVTLGYKFQRYEYAYSSTHDSTYSGSITEDEEEEISVYGGTLGINYQF